MPPPSLAEMELRPGTLVIADLHLDVGPAGAEPREFLEFLRRARGAPALLILGDLFDAWIGPAQSELPAAARVLDALRELAQSGCELHVLHGNRDFLLDASFERRTGARVHRDGLIGRSSAGRVLFLHGDELCTRDLGYQRLKRVVRSRPIRALAPRLPRPVALWVARRLRKASVRAVAAKPDESKTQQRSEAERLAAGFACPTLVVGHAHLWRDETAGGARWIVLDAFGGGRDCLRWGAGGALEAVSSARA